jgi:hypothetical protein
LEQRRRIKMKRLLSLLVTVSLAACTSMGRLDREAPPPGPDESIFIIGVDPEEFAIHVSSGRYTRPGRWGSPISRFLFAHPEGGYAVGRAKAGVPLGIEVVSYGDPKSIFGKSFYPCGENARTPVFVLPKGKVVYLGNIHYVLRSASVAARYTSDLDAARAYFRSAFPGIKQEVEKLEYDLLPADLSCRGDPIMIYLPAR